VSIVSSRRNALERAHRTTGRSKSRTHPNAHPTTLSVSPSGGRLALNGGNVAALIGVRTGPQIGAALRWLEEQVDDNPELNTRDALTALLRFAPRSAWDASRRSVSRADDASDDVREGTCPVAR
jgi:hypothetical protein